MIPITRGADDYLENATHKRIWKIRTTLKCKRKKKPNGEPDKHKAHTAANGDKLRRSMIRANAPLPVSYYSPTIMPLTFALILQLAVIQKLHMATMDIKSAYLNAPLPQDSDWVVTTLEHHIAIACGLDPAKEYRALYGLPDSGRIVYLQLFSQKGPVHHVRLRQLPLLPHHTNGNDIHNRVRRRYFYF